MTLNDQYDVFIKQLETRRRNPAKPSTLTAYSSHWRTHISKELGHLDLETIKNGIMRQFVATLSEKNLSAASINSVTQLVKSIISSCVDSNGDRVCNTVWNNDFLDLPPIENQNAPVMTRQTLQDALGRTQGQFRTLCTLAAGSGCRISEILSLRVGSRSESSFWDPEGSKLVIKTALWRGIEQSTKTKAGQREVDLCEELNQYLLDQKPKTEFLFAGPDGNSLRIRTLYDQAQKAGILGFHSARRWRVTHLRANRVPEDIIQFWIGHSSNKSITDRYSKLAQNIEERKKYANEAGLGFNLVAA